MNRTKIILVLAVCIGTGAWLGYTKFQMASLNQALCVAASQGDTAAVEKLLKRGASPDAVGSIGDTDCNCEDNPSPAPAVILAIFQTSGNHQEHLETVAALLRAGADVNARANSGMTALMWATSPRMVNFLLAHGAKVNLKDDHGDTALTHAAGNQDIARLLRQAGGI